MFIFTWKVEDLNLNDWEHGYSLYSPEFDAGISRSLWNLWIFPGGNTNDNREYLSCYLKNEDLILDKINIEFKIEIMGRYGEILACDKVTSHTFLKGKEWGWGKFVLKSRLLKELENNGTNNLTFRCHMINKELPPIDYDGCEARTKLGSNICLFQWNIQNLDCSTWSHKKTFFFHKELEYEITLTSSENLINIKILQKQNTSIMSKTKCKLSLLDIKGIEKVSKTDSHKFTTQDAVWKFPTFLYKNQLQDKDTLSEDGFFTLTFEFELKTILSEGIKKYSKGISDTVINADDVDTLIPFQKDFCNMFANRKHTDVKLIIEEEAFLAHKFILSARSPVFAAMFDQDMLENKSGVVEIKDLDVDTFKDFLSFIYTGKIDKMDNDGALKLLLAADKYQVISLKEKCCRFLKSVLSFENAFEILKVANMVNHDYLKSSAMDYIKSNADKLLSSPEWRQWIKQNLELATEVICNISTAFSGKSNE